MATEANIMMISTYVRLDIDQPFILSKSFSLNLAKGAVARDLQGSQPEGRGRVTR